jgi:hypothetical protein
MTRAAAARCRWSGRRPGLAAQEAVQLIGEGLAVLLAEGGRPTRVDAAGAQGVEEVAHGQARPDVVGGEAFAARAQCMAAGRDDLGGERDVGGDDEVAGFDAANDLVVRRIMIDGAGLLAIMPQLTLLLALAALLIGVAARLFRWE